MLHLISFNVNSIRARLPHVIDLLTEENPDIVLLQELKAQEPQFPKGPFEDLGYNIAVYGQKSWNGVAILSKSPIEDLHYGIPNYTDPLGHSRYIEGFTSGVRVASTYMPNGNPINTPKFDYKLNWMMGMGDHFKTLNTYDEPVIVGGDYNVIPTNLDANQPETWFKTEACADPKVRTLFQQWQTLGFTDALRHLNPDARYYTFWDYFRGSLSGNRGILLDFFFLNQCAKDQLIEGGVYKHVREKSKASDHAPIFIKLKAHS